MKNFGKCEETKQGTQIVIKDPGSNNTRSKVRVQNHNKVKVRVIQVDDCVITQGKRCDYLLILPDEQEIYIELKGSKVVYAVEQIIASIPRLTIDKSKQKLGFISSTRCPINSAEIQKFKKIARTKYNLKLTIKNGEIVHKI